MSHCHHCSCSEKPQDHKIEIRLILASVTFIYSFFAPSALFALIPFLIAGYDVIAEAAKNIFKGKMLDEHFLMTVAGIGALFLGKYSEAAAVMLFYQIGEFFQDRALENSSKNISKMMSSQADTACVVTDDGVETRDCRKIAPGTIIRISRGEKVPLDGVVTEGSSYLDTSALTGESVPRRISTGDTILAGTINTQSVLLVKTTRAWEDSTTAKINRLIEKATQSKSQSEKFITRFARIYTPSVVIAAFILALAGSLLTGDVRTWVYRSFTFLVISCPCALVISIPLAFFAGIGSLASKGIMTKGGTYIETLSRTRNMVFDKTGTLTSGQFAILSVTSCSELSEKRILELAAALEAGSDHPIARLLSAGKHTLKGSAITEIPGKGITGVVDSTTLFLGNRELMRTRNIKSEEYTGAGTCIFLADEKRVLGTILCGDTLKPGVKETLSALKKMKVKRCVMLTGDRSGEAEKVAKNIGITQVEADLLPEQKLKMMETLKESGITCYVGDGINDAPTLAASDVGIAMGKAGSDAAIEASDMVILNSDIRSLVTALKVSKSTMRVVKQNISFTLLVKLATLILGAAGIANIWMAIFADVGVAMLCILNSLRLLMTGHLHLEKGSESVVSCEADRNRKYE